MASFFKEEIDLAVKLLAQALLANNWWTKIMAQCKVSVCKTGDVFSIPGLRRSPGEGNGNPV